MKWTRRLTVIMGAAVLLSAGLLNGGPALADEVDDIVHDLQHCDVDAFDPEYDTSTNQVQGYAEISHCKFYFGFTVCLDYNGIVLQPSCKDYDSSATSGNTRKVNCMPGLWATTLILEGASNAGGYLGRHSFPPVLFGCALNSP